VAPPIELFSFDLETLRNRVGLVVCGDHDPYCPADKIRIMAAAFSCRLELIPGADHFFHSREVDLADCIANFARRGGYDRRGKTAWTSRDAGYLRQRG
jgi:alpha/beta superfamily hydrolase